MDDTLKYYIDGVKNYNEHLAFRLSEEIMKSEEQMNYNQRVLEKKVAELSSFKKASKYIYVIWDKKAHKWLSPDYYCVNQFGEVTNMERGIKLASQENFEIIYLNDIYIDDVRELIDLAGIGKLVVEHMKDFNIMAFGILHKSRWLLKTKWFKKYFGLEDFLYRNHRKESYKRI